MFGKRGEKEDKPCNIFLLVTECKQLLEIEFLSSFVLPPGPALDLGIQSEVGNQVNTCTADFRYYLHVDDSKIPKLQVWVSVCVLDVFI